MTISLVCLRGSLKPLDAGAVEEEDEALAADEDSGTAEDEAVSDSGGSESMKSSF